MRARYPDCEGIIVRDGVGIRYERYGRGRPTILLLPTWSIVPSRHWKMQVAYLARHFTVVCFDGRGSGGSGRPAEPAAYTDAQFASDAIAVMDAAGIETAVLVSASCGTLWALRLCADPVGWQIYNAHFWKTHYPEFVTFFMGRIFTERHSTKQVEDAIGWALEIDGETLAAAHLGLECCDAAATRRLAAGVACPILVMHGTHDAVRGYAEGEALADCTGGALVTLAGAGHFPHARDPVRVNLLIRQFADRVGR